MTYRRASERYHGEMYRLYRVLRRLCTDSSGTVNTERLRRLLYEQVQRLELFPPRLEDEEEKAA